MEHLEKKLKSISKELLKISEDLDAEHAMRDSYIRVSEEDSRRLTWILENILDRWTRSEIDEKMNKKKD